MICLAVPAPHFGHHCRRNGVRPEQVFAARGGQQQQSVGSLFRCPYSARQLRADPDDAVITYRQRRPPETEIRRRGSRCSQLLTQTAHYGSNTASLRGPRVFPASIWCRRSDLVDELLIRTAWSDVTIDVRPAIPCGSIPDAVAPKALPADSPRHVLW